MSATLSPLAGAGAQFFDNQGRVLAGGNLYTYLAGSTTPYTTWTTSVQGTANANPIPLDSAGRVPNEIWLQSGTLYKFVLKDSSGNTLGTWDNISGIAATASAQSEWQVSGLTPTYVAFNQFSVLGDQRTVFPANRRIQYFLSSGTYYGYVSSVSYDGTSVTTVTVGVDSTSLDSSLSAVSYGLLNSQNPSVPQNYIKTGDNASLGVVTATSITATSGTITNLTSSNVSITGGSISGVAGFSVPDYLYKAQGVI